MEAAHILNSDSKDPVLARCDAPRGRSAVRRAGRKSVRAIVVRSTLAALVALVACHEVTRPLHLDTSGTHPVSVVVTPAATTMTSGSTLNLVAITIDGSHNPLAGRRVTWSSSNPAIARLAVDSGTSPSTVAVTLSKAGQATIIATCEGMEGRATIVVAPGPAARLTVEPSTATVLTGDSLSLQAFATDLVGNSLGRPPASWSTSNPTVATVNPVNGVVRGVAIGTATIMATIDQVSAAEAVTVLADTVDVLTLSMQVARAGHIAKVLPDGRVLVVGGVPAGVRPQAEVYDPTSRTFSSADDMITVRGGHSAAALPDGTLLFLDGVVLRDGRTFFAGLPVGEIYDPASGTFSFAAGYVHTRLLGWSTATPLLDGRVLLTGAERTPDGGLSGATELFDPGNGAFSVAGAMNDFSDTSGWGTLLPDGAVLFVQWNFDSPPDAVDLYDPGNGTFSLVARSSPNHEYSQAVRLQDGRVLITGGQLPGGNGSSDAQLYMSTLRRLVSTTNIAVGRHLHAAALLRDGTVLITGGYSIWPTPTASAEIYRPPSAR